jgi:SAM-dependent methyltransferase
MNQSAASSYDEIPYAGGAFSSTHPDRLATAALLAGLTPPPVESCRVLELGCGIGGNLLPLALTLPEARLVGIDASVRQIAQARASANTLGLDNVSFVAGDIRALPGDLGSFDYVLCHGVFSWVPPDVQDAILGVCRDRMTPNGVAYISYNTYPGWHLRGLLHDLLAFHVRGQADAGERLRRGRALLDFLPDALPDPETLFARLLLKETENVKPSPDWYLFHEHLEGTNRPLYFHEFAGRAQAHGLHYLGEAQPWPPEHPALFPATVSQLADFSADLIEREQYEDFLRCRVFRRTLLCHAAAKPQSEPSSDAVMKLRVTGMVRPASERPDVASDAPERFLTPKEATVTTNHPVIKAALVSLAGVSPRSVPFGALWQAVRARLGRRLVSDEEGQDQEGQQFLAEALLRCRASDLVELHTLGDAFVVEPGERPLASPVARLQAAAGVERVTNLRHRDVELNEFDRLLLPFLNGTRDRAALVEQLATLADQDVFTVQHQGQPVRDAALLREVLGAWVEEALHRLGPQALLACSTT